MDPAALERLRKWRNKPEPAWGLGTELAAIGKTIRKQGRTFGAVGGAWAGVVPAGLAARSGLVSLLRGVLTVRVPNASVKYELDGWLRAGGELELIKRCPAGLTRVRSIVDAGAFQEPGAPRRRGAGDVAADEPA